MSLANLYLSLIMVVLIHEIIHILLLKLYHVHIIQVNIGSLVFLRINNFALSPFIISGYVEFSSLEFNGISKFKKILFYLLPSLCNLGLGYIFYDLFFYFSIFNILYGIVNLFPLPFSGSDGMNVVTILIFE